MSHQVIVFLLVLCIGSKVIGQIPIRGEDLPAYYDFATGNLTIDTTNVIGGRSIGHAIEPGLFRPENSTPFMNSPFATATNDSVAEVNFQGVPGGVYSVGDVMLPGLTEEELIEIYFGLDSIGRPSGSLHDQRKYYVSGGLGANTFHLLKPVYAPSPYPALNDPDASSTPVDRWATAATVSYDPRDGAVTLDTTGELGGAIWLYELALNHSAAFDLNALTPAVKELSPAVTDNIIVEAGLGWIDEGVYPLGTILPAGMSDAELGSIVERFQFIGQPGHSVASLDITTSGVPLSIVVVPEPRMGVGLFIALFFLMKANRESQTLFGTIGEVKRSVRSSE